MVNSIFEANTFKKFQHTFMFLKNIHNKLRTEKKFPHYNKGHI